MVVNVDHLNDLPGDDRVENLEPACFWCNANRSWFPLVFDEDRWRTLRAMLGQVHPAHRPHLPTLAALFLGVDEASIWETIKAAQEAA
jgi:hypothetical protein